MKRETVNIAFLSNQISWGGAPKSLLLLIKALRLKNYKSYLFVTHCSSEEMRREYEQYVEFVKIITLPEITSAQTQTVKHNSEKLEVNRINHISTLKFAKELNNLEIDILHINNSVFSAIYSTIKTTTKIRIVSHIREWIDWNGINQKQSFIINEISKNSDAIVCISDTEAKIFQNHPNLFIIPNPFDFQEIESISSNKLQVKNSLGITKNDFVVGMVGRTQNKGTLDFLKALSYIKEKYVKDFTNFRFVVLGEAEPKSSSRFILLARKLMGKNLYSDIIYKYIKNEELFEKVIFLSKRRNALEIINNFDVAVRPSYTGDPWGRDIIEYMALNKPIVATGTSEFFVKNGLTGYLVTPRDYRDLAEKIYWLYKNPVEQESMGKKAFEIVFNMCNLETYRESIDKVYNSVLNMK